MKPIKLFTKYYYLFEVFYKKCNKNIWKKNAHYLYCLTYNCV